MPVLSVVVASFAVGVLSIFAVTLAYVDWWSHRA